MTEPLRTLRRLGITGTDTGIGKTVVSCALAARARQLGIRVAAMKPVESGIDDRAPLSSAIDTAQAPLSDAERLRIACGSVDDLTAIRPYVLAEPLAPMVAADRAGVQLDIAHLDAARSRLEAERELLLVEGAGGLLVPITHELSYAGLFARWGCDVVIVAGNRLGVLNHALLTVQAAEQAGLRVRAVVLPTMTGAAPGIAESTNFGVLQRLLPRHALHAFPFVASVHDTGALAAAAQLAGLDALLSADSADRD